MATPITAPIQQNLTPVVDPQLVDTLGLWKTNVMMDINCQHVGVIQSFDPAKQTATITIAYKKTYFELNKTSGLYSPVLVSYPILIDCPVVVLGGGSAHLTFPIAKGDECLVLFNDRDIDNWFHSGQPGPVSTPRLHSIADGFALVGVRSMPNVLTSYDSTRAVLGYGTTIVGVGASKVKIANNSTTLNTLLQNILTQLENLATAAAAISVSGVTTGPGVSGPPQNAATFTSISTQLSSLATQLGGLLE